MYKKKNRLSRNIASGASILTVIPINNTFLEVYCHVGKVMKSTAESACADLFLKARMEANRGVLFVSQL